MSSDSHLYDRVLASLRRQSAPLLSEQQYGRDFMALESSGPLDPFSDARYVSVPEGTIFRPVLLGTVREARAEVFLCVFLICGVFYPADSSLVLFFWSL
jgi:hypothetical protein